MSSLIFPSRFSGVNAALKQEEYHLNFDKTKCKLYKHPFVYDPDIWGERDPGDGFFGYNVGDGCIGEYKGRILSFTNIPAEKVTKEHCENLLKYSTKTFEDIILEENEEKMRMIRITEKNMRSIIEKSQNQSYEILTKLSEEMIARHAIESSQKEFFEGIARKFQEGFRETKQSELVNIVTMVIESRPELFENVVKKIHRKQMGSFRKYQNRVQEHIRKYQNHTRDHIEKLENIIRTNIPHDTPIQFEDLPDDWDIVSQKSSSFGDFDCLNDEDNSSANENE